MDSLSDDDRLTLAVSYGAITFLEPVFALHALLCRSIIHYDTSCSGVCVIGIYYLSVHCIT